MSTEVDYYDVQAMIRDERSSIRAEIAAAVQAACTELRAEFRQELLALTSVVNSRTEHLA